MAKIKQLNVALLGLGTVGKGLVSLLKENEAEILNKHGAKVNIVKIFERNADKRTDRYDDDLRCGERQ